MGELVSPRVLAVLIILSAGRGGASQNVVIKNRIADCITIEKRSTSTDANLVILGVELTIKKSSGECGCMSASATYRSYIVRGSGRELLQEGQIRVLEGGVRKFVLASDAPLVDGQQVTVEISCTPPK
jgi:hypothetical protein